MDILLLPLDIVVAISEYLTLADTYRLRFVNRAYARLFDLQFLRNLQVTTYERSIARNDVIYSLNYVKYLINVSEFPVRFRPRG